MVVDYTTKGDAFVPGQPRRWADRRLTAMGNVALLDGAPDGKGIAAVVLPFFDLRQHNHRICDYLMEVRLCELFWGASG